MERIANIEAPTKEEVAIIDIRQRISDVILADDKFDDDFYLLLWLKAQELNPAKAEVMIRESIQWRQENKIQPNFEDEFSPDFLKTHQVLFSKTKDGVPLAYFQVGKMDLKSGLASYGKSGCVKYWAKVTAMLEDKMVEFNQSQTNKPTRLTSDSALPMVCLVNVQDFSSLQLLHTDLLSCCVESAQNLAKYFPGIVGTLIYYNMNPVFSTVLNAVKPFLSWPNLKLEVYGTDQNIWRERLVKIVSLEDLNQLESQ